MRNADSLVCSLTRRDFLRTSAVAAAPGALPATATRNPAAVPMLHVTDLFRPHNDPDDHWDLACVYALAHAALFDLPCPIYWMPCFEERPGQDTWQVMEFGTFYRFLQSDILPHLLPHLKNFFAWMYQHGRSAKSDPPAGCDWLRYLLGPNDEALLARQGALPRNMWCTGGFLHATGQTVTREGRIVPLTGSGQDAVFAFEPIRVQCSDGGVTQWTPNPRAQDRFLFRVRDQENYASAMTIAMKSLLQSIP
ncbi:MAG: twin-arginine translocation signal domain-containing protein [Planctomycetes bacterium]|nr:twin-arginine translocation signal domain-containing protein [Planctomycetota bacterium]